MSPQCSGHERAGCVRRRDEDDMGQKILQINFKVTTTTADYAKMVAPLADPIAKVHGLV